MGYAAARAHDHVDEHGDGEKLRKGQQDKTHSKRSQRYTGGAVRLIAADQPRRVQGAGEGPDPPTAVKPSVADGAGVHDAVTQRSGDRALGQHGPDEQRPAGP